MEEKHKPQLTPNEILQDMVEEWIEDREKADEKYGHISDWDVSHVTNMGELFFKKRRFNEDLSCWDTGKVENIKRMFKGCRIDGKSRKFWRQCRR